MVSNKYNLMNDKIEVCKWIMNMTLEDFYEFCCEIEDCYDMDVFPFFCCSDCHKLFKDECDYKCQENFFEYYGVKL